MPQISLLNCSIYCYSVFVVVFCLLISLLIYWLLKISIWLNRFWNQWRASSKGYQLVKSESINSCFPSCIYSSLRFVFSKFDSKHVQRFFISSFSETGLNNDGLVKVIFFMLAASSKESWILKTIGQGFWRVASSLALINSTLSL